MRDKRKSLFSPGILRVVGEFCAQDAVSLCDRAGREFGRGLANYSAEVGLAVGGWGRRGWCGLGGSNGDWC